MDKSKLYSIIITIIASIVIVLWMTFDTLTFDPATLPNPPRPTTAMMPEEEEFAELLDLYQPHVSKPSDPAPALTEVPLNNRAVAAPPTGPDLDNAGNAGAPIPETTSTRPSEVKNTTPPHPETPGPDKAELERLDKIRREANASVNSAFKKSEGKNNANNKSKNPEGDAGKTSGTETSTSGTGTGTVGGGWRIPNYAKVPYNRTGSIVLVAIVDRTGKVTSVELAGGQAPAAADKALIEACMAEVRRRTFTRSDDNAPERSTARITYKFR